MRQLLGACMKIFIVVAFAALCAAVGETLLSYGMRRYGVIELDNLSHVVTLVLSVGKNGYVFTGVVFLALFFFLYLAALSWADLSYVLPLTAMSYIFAAVLAKFALKEDVSWQRWVGTAVIVIGISFVAMENKPRSGVAPENLPLGSDNARSRHDHQVKE